MGYAEDAMAELHGDRMIDNTPPTAQAAYAAGPETADWRRELEKRGQEIDSAMGRYRGTEPLIEAVKRLASDYHEASTKGYVLREVEVELQKARATHAPMNGHHEGYAVILEELDELWEVCKKNTHGTVTFPKEAKKLMMRKEAIQVAAMAVRFIEDVCDKSK